jgi:hypothetical protein
MVMNSLPFNTQGHKGEGEGDVMVFFHIRQATHPLPNLPVEGGEEERIPDLKKILYERERTNTISSADLGGA